ncbi:MAG: NAD-dependent dihydropyrimidine dehydrogenase subunit PreA [Tepidanaerobacteraceae bacterium]
MSVSLQVDFAGMRFKNPFMLSSAPPTTDGEMIQRAFEQGWGGAVIKTLAYDIRQAQNVNPRIQALKLDNEIIGFTNFELGSPRTIETWLEEIVQIKKNYPDNILLASLLHTEGLVKEQWSEVSRKCAQAGVDGFELNFSCSHGMAESGGGAVIGSNPDLIRQVVGWVREAVDLPIMVKFPAMVDNLPQKVRIAKEVGADAASVINTLNSIPSIDIYNFVPNPAVDGKSAFMGMSGSTIRPIALRCVAQIAGNVDIPVSGMGGIDNWINAVEFILVGASNLQVCSAVMQHGYRIIDDLKMGLINYMEEMGFKTINDFCGLALQNIKRHNDLSRTYKLTSHVNEEKCIGCGKCFVACNDNGYKAITMSEDRIAVVDKEKCDGCGLCSQICPVDNCMTMIRK